MEQLNSRRIKYVLVTLETGRRHIFRNNIFKCSIHPISYTLRHPYISHCILLFTSNFSISFANIVSFILYDSALSNAYNKALYKLYYIYKLLELLYVCNLYLYYIVIGIYILHA